MCTRVRAQPRRLLPSHLLCEPHAATPLLLPGSTCRPLSPTAQHTALCARQNYYASSSPHRLAPPADASAAAAPSAEGTDASNGGRRLQQSEDATGADALAADDSAAEAEAELLEVTGAANGTDNTTVAVMPPCRPPSSATEPADIFFYFLW